MPDWKALAATWRDDPLKFVLEALFRVTEDQWKPWIPGTPRPSRSPTGPELWQGNLLRDVRAAHADGLRHFSVRSGHGTGKTTLEAWLILWFLIHKHPCKIPCTANSQDQLRDVLWAEVAKWHRELPPFLRNEIDIGVDRATWKSRPDECFAVARTARPERPEALQGFHADNLLFVIDEASSIEDIIFETAGGSLSSKNSWVFMAGNPTRPDGYFFRSHTENRDAWRTYHVSCYDSSRATEDYAERIAKEYGRTSSTYAIRVLGEFPDASHDVLISPRLVMSAVDRDVSPSDHAVVWGLDIARYGDDTTALARRCGNVLLGPVTEWSKLDNMQVAGVIAHEYMSARVRPAAINCDVIGWGAGVVDRLRELGLPARGINVAEVPAVDPGRFLRLRDELWWKVREWFESRAVTIPRDDALIAELVRPRYKLESTGKIKVESKDELKKRLGRDGRSPNKADALCLTFAGGDFAFARRPAYAITEYDPFDPPRERFDERGRVAISGIYYDPFSMP